MLVILHLTSPTFSQSIRSVLYTRTPTFVGCLCDVGYFCTEEASELMVDFFSCVRMLNFIRLTTNSSNHTSQTMWIRE